MGIYSEPKNGDFARYVEELTRAGGVGPGRASDKREASRPAVQPVPSSSSESISSSSWGKSSRPAQAEPGVSMPAPSGPGQEDAGTVSLAQRARHRKIGMVLTIAALLVGWNAARMAFEALQYGEFDLDALMPAIFLAFFALMLFKAGRRARNPPRSRLEKLPPLTPSAHRKNDS